MSASDHLSCGVIFDDTYHPVFHGKGHLEFAVREVRELDYDFGVIPLSHPAYSTLSDLDDHGDSPTSPDFILLPSTWNTQLMAQVPQEVVDDLERSFSRFSPAI